MFIDHDQLTSAMKDHQAFLAWILQLEHGLSGKLLVN
jgi:hypothetical protein